MIFKNEYETDDDNDNDNDTENDNDNDSDCDSNDSFDENVYLKISDFGISHAIQANNISKFDMEKDKDKGNENSNINGKAYMKYKCGTYYYTAPEVKDVK